MSAASRQQLARGAAFVAVAIAAIAIIVVLTTGGSSYVINARFQDAGQLVGGDLVTVAGHTVGSVGNITLTANGLANVELDISDSSVTPIRSTTIATIGQVSLTGVANRFVGLTLGATGRELKSGDTLPSTQTRGIVDLDVLLDSLTKPVRSQLQQLFKTGAYVFSSPTPQLANKAFDYLNPALSQTAALGRQIVANQYALEQLLTTTSQISTALAARSGDISGAITNTATALNEVASQRAALSDSIARAPAVLAQSDAVLKDVDYALGILNPVLRDLQPTAPKLARFLTVLAPTTANLTPTISGIEKIVPGAQKALREFPSVEKKATPAVSSLAQALPPLTPVLAGLRPYIPDIVSGFFGGIGGQSGGTYDANGHYVGTSAELGSGSLSGLVSLLNTVLSALPGLNGTRFDITAACPGGAAEPAADGSNPWSTPDSGQTVCKPADNLP
jgi:phospholipid/cholesterol/gamma-HCH transport system substrate-binding protein